MGRNPITARVMAIRQRSFLGRVTVGMSGQAFSRLIQAAYTIMLVPLLIRAWGLEGYGQWIALTALTSYLGLSNFGLVTTAANEMVIASSAGDEARARQTFQVSINLALYVVLPIIAAVVLVLGRVHVGRGLHLTQIGPSAAYTIIACMGAALWFQTLRGLNVAALYAAGSYAFAYYVQGVIKLIELAGIAVIVGGFAGSQAAAAMVIATAAFAELVVVAASARRAAAWARFDPFAFDRAWLARHVRPAVGFMVSNFATGGLMSQGPRVVLGAMLGGQAVAVYAVYGTAMRFVDQLLLTLVLPLEVEIAQCAGRRELARIYALIIKGTHVSWAMYLLVVCGLLLFGPLVFRIWTTDRIPFSYALMGLYMGLSAANLLGRVSLHALISTNRLYGISFALLITAAAAIGGGALLARSMGIGGMIVGGACGEAVNALVVIAATARWLGRPASGMLRDLLDFRGSLALMRTQGTALLSLLVRGR
jgi:O-antigen/teichoic acid export membrane protein